MATRRGEGTAMGRVGVLGRRRWTVVVAVVMALVAVGPLTLAAPRAGATAPRSVPGVVGVSDNFWLVTPRGASSLRCPVLRAAGPAQPPDRGRRQDHRLNGATGWWPPTAGCSPTGTPASTARPATSPQPAHRRHDPHPGRPGLLVGGLRRRGVHLRGRRLLRFDRVRLNQPIVGMAPAPDGDGYWLVASGRRCVHLRRRRLLRLDRHLALNQPIVAIAADTSGQGYWLVAARRRGLRLRRRRASTARGRRPGEPAGRLVPTPSATGYWIVQQNGTAHAVRRRRLGRAPAPGPAVQPVTPGDQAVLFAFLQLGKPYIWGGNGPVGYDCSGLALASWSTGPASASPGWPTTSTTRPDAGHR